MPLTASDFGLPQRNPFPEWAPQQRSISIMLVVGLLDADDVMEVYLNGAEVGTALGVLLQAVDDDVEGLTHLFARALAETRRVFAEKYPGYHLGIPEPGEDGRMFVEVHSNDTDVNVRPADLPKVA